jgi:hypothetical protein
MYICNIAVYGIRCTDGVPPLLLPLNPERILALGEWWQLPVSHYLPRPTLYAGPNGGAGSQTGRGSQVVIRGGDEAYGRTWRASREKTNPRPAV